MEDTKKWLVDELLEYKIACSLDDIFCIEITSSLFCNLTFTLSNQKKIERAAHHNYKMFVENFAYYKNLLVQSTVAPNAHAVHGTKCGNLI